MEARHVITGRELSSTDIERIFGLAGELKRAGSEYHDAMRGKTLAMIFMKSSTRTRVSFEVGMAQMGGHALFLTPEHIQIGRDETIADTARVLSRYVNLIMARVYAHQAVVDLAEYASVPVMNGLCDRYHPIQILADMFTLKERFGSLAGLKLAFVGDGNNVCHSLILASAAVGSHITVVCPRGYSPSQEIVDLAAEDAKRTGSSICVTDELAAIDGTDMVYTDTWVSMGQEDDRASRLAAFEPYQVNENVMRRAKPTAVFMHCLPAHRGEEVTREVIDGPASVVFDQAENRLYVQKALMLFLIGGPGYVAS